MSPARVHVCFVVTQLSHASPGSYYRPYEMARHLAARGGAAVLLTPFEEDAAAPGDVRVAALRGPDRYPRFARLAYGLLRKTLYSRRLGRFIPYDRVLLGLARRLEESLERSLDPAPDVLQGEQEVAALAAIAVGRRRGIPVVADLHNIWAEELVAAGHLDRGSATFDKLLSIERSIAEKADHTIVVSDSMKDYLVSTLGAEAARVTVVPPGGEVLAGASVSPPGTLSGPRRVVYAGLVDRRAHVDLLVRSIPIVARRRPGVEFLIAEQGEGVRDIKALCRSLAVAPRFYWFTSQQDARALLTSCQVGALPSRDDLARRLGTPIKLLEYMSHGLPVVANDIGSWCDVIRRHSIGILTRDDPESFAGGICALLDSPLLHATLRRNMLALVEEDFSWAAHVERVLLPLYQGLRP